MHWFHPGSAAWASAEAQGILFGPKPRLLTGDHLIARGLEPGPMFGSVLARAEEEQDREGWTTKAEAIKWLDGQGELK